MSELITAARPYARATFELARDQKRYQQWSEMLSFMAAVSMDPSLRALLDSPRMTSQTSSELLVSVCTDQVDSEGQNLIRVLAENGRLGLLPEISALYEKYRSEAEGKLEAEVVSARELDAEQQQTLAKALKARLGRDVDLKISIDPSLLAGAIIRAGDLVIDGSIRSKLSRLATALTR